MRYGLKEMIQKYGAEAVAPGACLDSSEMLKFLVKDMFGTFYIEPYNWTFPDSVRIGRTFFADRMKKTAAFNTTVTDNIRNVYQAALNGKSTYDAPTVSRRLAKMYREVVQGDFDFLMLFGDESEELVKMKIQMHINLLLDITLLFEDVERMPYEILRDAVGMRSVKMHMNFLDMSPGGYTQTVLEKWQEYVPLRKSEDRLKKE